MLNSYNIQIFEYYNTFWVMAMPHRALVTKQLAEFLAVLAHPHRIRIVEELREGENDVNSLRDALGITHSSVSQHLMVLRANRFVSERREGRRVFYHLCQPEIARWLLEATHFLEKETVEAIELRKAIGKTRKEWSRH
jgi:DNA-binding transcriptional ArsR family regulator